MKGRVVALGQIDGREAAALMIDGLLHDLYLDAQDDSGPLPGEIHRAVADRPIKGQNGMTLKLGGGETGFLRNAKGIAPGDVLLVQVSGRAEDGKAAPVTPKLLFKGRYAIVTPDAPGLNIARSIRDEEMRLRLHDLASEAMTRANQSTGCIIRSAAEGADDGAILDDLDHLLSLNDAVLSEAEGKGPELLCAAPSSHYRAWVEWATPPPDMVDDSAEALENHGVLDQLEDLSNAAIRLSEGGHYYVEETRALIAVDVNTGGDFSFAAGLKANLATLRDLPRQLRLRGLGGQIVIDMAPMPKKERRAAEQTIARAFKSDGVETVFVGWTPLGHIELQRKRDRIPLRLLLSRQ